jgi:hypothetical protein
MRVFGRVLIVSGLLSALATAPASAAPILASTGDSGVECGLALDIASSGCSLFSLGMLTGGTTFDFDLEFTSDTDVALFAFSVDADATFAVSTLSTGLFPFLGLFSETGTLYSYIDPVNGELQAQGFDALSEVSLTGGSLYYLAVLLFPNGFGGTATSLLEPFACDGIVNDCTGVGGNVAVSLQAVSDEQPVGVPEPGTLALFGCGAFAAMVRRRSRKRS